MGECGRYRRRKHRKRPPRAPQTPGFQREESPTCNLRWLRLLGSRGEPGGLGSTCSSATHRQRHAGQVPEALHAALPSSLIGGEATAAVTGRYGLKR